MTCTGSGAALWSATLVDQTQSLFEDVPTSCTRQQEFVNLFS